MRDYTQRIAIQKAMHAFPGYTSVEQSLNSYNVKDGHNYAAGKRMYNEILGWSEYHGTYKDALEELTQKHLAKEAREEVEKAGSVQ